MSRESLQDRLPTGREAFYVLGITLFLYFVCIAIFGGSTNKLYVLLMEILLIVPVLVFGWRRKYSFSKIFRFRKVPFSLLFVGAVLGMGLSLLADFMDRFIQSVIPMPESIVHSLKAYMIFHSIEEAILLFFTVVIVAGLVEEMLFRGFLQEIIEHSGGILKSILVPAIVFSIFHFNPWGILPIFAIGLVLGIVSWRCQSILPCIVLHGTHNGIATILYNLSPKAMEWYVHENAIRPFWMAMGIGLTGIGLLLLFHITPSTKRDAI
jgi:membrane protease YdiL (CAAX protease family)